MLSQLDILRKSLKKITIQIGKAIQIWDGDRYKEEIFELEME